MCLNFTAGKYRCVKKCAQILRRDILRETCYVEKCLTVLWKRLGVLYPWVTMPSQPTLLSQSTHGQKKPLRRIEMKQNKVKEANDGREADHERQEASTQNGTLQNANTWRRANTVSHRLWKTHQCLWCLSIYIFTSRYILCFAVEANLFDSYWTHIGLIFFGMLQVPQGNLSWKKKNLLSRSG